MSGRLICSDVGASAALLMVWFGVIARLAGVPDWNIVTTRVTIIPVIVVLLGIERTATVSAWSGQGYCGEGSGGGRYMAWCWSDRWCGGGRYGRDRRGYGTGQGIGLPAVTTIAMTALVGVRRSVVWCGRCV
jgi:hypothetical protein